MPRAKKLSEEDLKIYAAKIAYYRQEFFKLSDIPEKAVETSSYSIVNQGNKPVYTEFTADTMRTYDLFTRRKIVIKKEFCIELDEWPLGEKNLLWQLEHFKLDIMEQYKNCSNQPVTELPSLIYNRKGNVRHEIFGIWRDCIQVYKMKEGGFTHNEIAKKVFGRVRASKPSKSQYYYKMAKQYILQAIAGTFPSPLPE
ncbi:MAG: hypothetical protein VB050_18315 [Geobacteraceae bacterium]|nr:hypothetical protein [Geobacteraceae bacterium]